MALTTAPVELVSLDGSVTINDSSADVDFRIESNGNQHMLFVDAGNDHVNIGTSTDYGGVLNIETTDNGTNLLLASTDTDANAGPVLVLYRQSTSSAADGDAIGKIDVMAYNDANQNITFAQIAGLISDASDGSEDGQLQINLMSSASSRSFVDFIGSTGTVFNEGSVVNLDFRVESDSNSHMLFVDAGNDRVMIGKSSTGLANQGVEFEDGQIKGTATGQTVAFLNRASDDGTILDIRKDNSVVGTIGSNSAGGVPTFDFSSNSSSGIIRFLTSGSEILRIDNSGNSLFGTTVLTDIASSGTGNEGSFIKADGSSGFATSNQTLMTLNRKTSNGDVFEFRKDGTTVGSIGIEGGDSLYIQSDGASGGGLRFHNNGGIAPMRNGSLVDDVVDLGTSTKRFQDLYLSGNVIVASGQGIDFSATSDSSGSMGSELLDDYEEGTWTPVPKAGSTTIAHSISRARYIKVGGQVTVSCTIAIDEGSLSGVFGVYGAPFSSSINIENHGACMMNDVHFAHTYNTICVYFYPSNGYFQFYGTRDAANWEPVEASALFSDSAVQFTVTYFTA